MCFNTNQHLWDVEVPPLESYPQASCCCWWCPQYQNMRIRAVYEPPHVLVSCFFLCDILWFTWTKSNRNTNNTIVFPIDLKATEYLWSTMEPTRFVITSQPTNQPANAHNGSRTWLKTGTICEDSKEKSGSSQPGHMTTIPVETRRQTNFYAYVCTMSSLPRTTTRNEKRELNCTNVAFASLRMKQSRRSCSATLCPADPHTQQDPGTSLRLQNPYRVLLH